MSYSRGVVGLLPIHYCCSPTIGIEQLSVMNLEDIAGTHDGV